MSDDDIMVVDAPERSRFEILRDGDLAGVAEYELVDGRTVFTHTEIDPAFEGQGLGSTLVQGALDLVRARGGRIVALCPFVARYLERHRAETDLVDHELDAVLRAR